MRCASSQMRWVVTAMILSLVGCASDLEEQNHPRVVPVGSLASSADKFEGRLMTVVGIARFEFENEAMFSSSENVCMDIFPSAIWVDLPPSMQSRKRELDLQWVAATGTFETQRRGHQGLYAGTLTNVRRIVPWHSPARRVTCADVD